MKLSVEELQKCVEKVIEILPEYESIEDVFIDALKTIIGELKVDPITSMEKEEICRDIYRALKMTFKVELIEDRFTREDLDILKHAVDDLERSKSNPAGYAIEDVNRAIAHIKTAMQR